MPYDVAAAMPPGDVVDQTQHLLSLSLTASSHLFTDHRMENVQGMRFHRELSL